MNYQEIVKEISAGLTGFADKDLPYLTVQKNTYEGHSQKEEILRAISRMVYELTPEGQRIAPEPSTDDETKSIYRIFQEA